MRMNSTILVGAGALLGASAALLIASAPVQSNGTQTPGSAPAQAPAQSGTPPTAGSEQQIKADTYAAMTQLSKLIGRWDVTGQSYEADGTPAETFNGAAVFSLALGENFILGDWTLHSGQFVLEQIDYFGYSPGLRRYTHAMLTQLDKSMIYQQGVWLPEANTLSFTMAAPLDTPSGKPRNVGLEYSWMPNNQIAVTMSMQSGAGPLRTVRMMLTPSKEPAAPTGPGGMPTGGLSALSGGQANMATMQKALGQMNAQKQAMQQYMSNMRQQTQSLSDQMNQLTR